MIGSTGMNGIGISSSAGSAPTAMYRPNFSQAFQRTGPYPLFPGATPFTSGNLLSNGKFQIMCFINLQNNRMEKIHDVLMI